MVVLFGWFVLALVFLDELLVFAVFGVWGWSTALPWLLVWLAPLLATVAWSLFASTKARFGGPVVRPVAQAIVVALACTALSATDRSSLAIWLLVVSVVVNVAAMIPAIRKLPTAPARIE